MSLYVEKHALDDSLLRRVIRAIIHSRIRWKMFAANRSCRLARAEARRRTIPHPFFRVFVHKIIRLRGLRINWPLLTAGGRPKGLPLSPRRRNIAL